MGNAPSEATSSPASRSVSPTTTASSARRSAASSPPAISRDDRLAASASTSVVVPAADVSNDSCRSDFWRPARTGGRGGAGPWRRTASGARVLGPSGAAAAEGLGAWGNSGRPELVPSGLGARPSGSPAGRLGRPPRAGRVTICSAFASGRRSRATDRPTAGTVQSVPDLRAWVSRLEWCQVSGASHDRLPSPLRASVAEAAHATPRVPDPHRHHVRRCPGRRAPQSGAPHLPMLLRA